MHAGVARGVLHLVELSLLFIELHPDLHELPGLITIGQHLGLGGPVRVLHGHVELVGARLQCRNFIFLRHDLPLPLLGSTLLF
jgi:hypothetical protein